MTSFLENLNPTTAKGLVLSLTLTLMALGEEIVRTKSAKVVKAKVARFQQLNAERCRLIQEHGLQDFAAAI